MNNPLRLLTIPIWLCLHYIIAALIMFFAAPSPTALEIETATGNIIDHNMIGVVFATCAIFLALDYTITPRRFFLYLSAWIIYVITATAIGIKHLITGDPIPGIYLATLGYIGGIVFMILAYNVYGTVAQVSEYIARKEPYWLSLLSKTDLRDYHDN